MNNSLNLSGPGLDLTDMERWYNILPPHLLLLPSSHQWGHRATLVLNSCCVGMFCHAVTQKPYPALSWKSGVREKQTAWFLFLMFVLLFLFSLILRASSLIYWRLTNQWLFHAERLLFVILNVTKIWLILQQSILTLLQKSYNFSVERHSYPDNYSQVYSRDRSESNTFTLVKISPE